MKLKRKHYFGSVVLSSEEKRAEWLTAAHDIGVKDSRQESRVRRRRGVRGKGAR